MARGQRVDERHEMASWRGRYELVKRMPARSPKAATGNLNRADDTVYGSLSSGYARHACRPESSGYWSAPAFPVTLECPRRQQEDEWQSCVAEYEDSLRLHSRLDWHNAAPVTRRIRD